MVLKASRFFPEEDDNPEQHGTYKDTNIKANKFLNRQVDIDDVVSAHMLALEKSASIGFAR